MIVAALALCLSPARAEPRTVVDYYYLLPNRYFPMIIHAESHAERQQQLADTHPRIDLRRGYLWLSTVRQHGRIGTGDGSLTIDLFRRAEGRPLIAVTLSAPAGGSIPLALYEWRNGKLMEVPTRWPSDLHCVLPRFGNTIRRSRGDWRGEQPVSSLLWDGRNFKEQK